jgi:hypothetical protein
MMKKRVEVDTVMTAQREFCEDPFMNPPPCGFDQVMGDVEEEEPPVWAWAIFRVLPHSALDEYDICDYYVTKRYGRGCIRKGCGGSILQSWVIERPFVPRPPEGRATLTFEDRYDDMKDELLESPEHLGEAA